MHHERIVKVEFPVEDVEVHHLIAHFHHEYFQVLHLSTKTKTKESTCISLVIINLHFLIQ
jgi:hypothetical protein